MKRTNRFGGMGRGRHRKSRKIDFSIDATFFKPAGIPLYSLEVVEITHDELEAIRLVDLLDMHQEEAGKKMGVSRGPVSRDCSSAHKKIADALTSGKAIKIVQ